MSTGFESMDKDHLREVQSKGGKTGKKHSFTDEERRKAAETKKRNRHAFTNEERSRGGKNAQSHPNVKKARLTPGTAPNILSKRWPKPPIEKEEKDD